MSDTLIVRQPVFDRSDSAVGHELRFRVSNDEGDPFARSYLSGSFDVLRSGLPAYVRCTRQQLLDKIFDSAEPSSLRMCEAIGGKDAGMLFLIGLFSLLDAMFRMPLSDVLERINLAEKAREALLDRTGPFGSALNFVEAYELGLWEQATSLAKELGVAPDRISAIYTDAVKWATDQLSPAALEAA